jgi:hypothetical protein
MADPAAVRQAAKDLYRQMMLQDPTEGQLNSFVEQVRQGQASAPMTEQYDIGAAIRSAIERTGTYGEMYGKRPSGVSEEEYQTMMRQGQASILGSELAGNAAARVGMRTGSLQTAVGAAAGTKEAWENSRFLERLAVASNVFSKMT